jgi:pilus assembly protein CpaB
MNRKWVGVAIAVALALVGTLVLVRYVQGADSRALQGEETVAVLVVDSRIEAGTPAEDISGNVREELVPAKIQARGSLGSTDDLRSLEGLVASVDLLPGEQVIASRFIPPEVLDEQDEIAVPDGMIVVTLSLSPERAIGGVLRPGDEVAVFSSFTPVAADVVDSDGAVPSSPSGETGNTTSIILHKVLVTNVQVEELPQENTSQDTNTAMLGLSPTGNLLVTLAMLPANAERFIFTAEFGRVWLAEEPGIVDEKNTGIQDRSTVYQDPGSEG